MPKKEDSTHSTKPKRSPKAKAAKAETTKVAVAPTTDIHDTAPVSTNDAPAEQKTESTTEQSPKRIGLILVAALAVVFVAGLLFSVQSLTPEERLQKVISNTGTINSVRQSFNAYVNDTSSQEKQSYMINSNNNFANPSHPKSAGRYEIKIQSSGNSLHVKSDFRCISEKLCYAQYTTIKLGTQASNDSLPKLNTWLEFNPGDDTSSVKADPFKITKGVNTVLGEIISGNISGEAKQAIDSSVGTDKAYNVVSSKEEKYNGNKSIHYVVTLNADKVYALNKITAAQYKISNVFEDSSEISKSLDLWVDPSTNLIQKLSSKKDGMTSSITFSNYNEKVIVQAPGTSI